MHTTHHSAAGRLGGLVKASRYPPAELTTAARSAFLSRFEVEVDPERVLDAAERLRRAALARRVYFTRLAQRSAAARARRAVLR